MRNQISAQLNNVITGLLIGAVALTPLIFTPFFTEFYESSKIALLLVITIVLVVLWGLSWILKGKVLITRSPLDIPFLLLIGVVVISTVLSSSQYISIIGNFPKIHGSATTYVLYALFYFVAVSHLRTVNQVRNLYLAMLASGVIVSIVTLLSYFNLYLPFQIVQFPNFTPTGSSFSTAALLSLLLALPMVAIIRPTKLLPQPVAAVIATLFLLTIALIGSNSNNDATVLLSSPYVATYAVIGLTIFLFRSQITKKTLPLLLTPIIATLIIVGVSVLPMGDKNPLNQKLLSFPREVQLSLSTSWKVSVSAFRDSTFFGTGPATYLFNFTQYKPVEHNDSRFWNIRFDSAYNEYLQTLGTLGLFGTLALLFLTIVVLSFSWKGLNVKDNDLSLSLAISAIAGVVILLTHVTTAVVMVALVAILAMLMATHKSISGKVEELTFGIRASKSHDPNSVVGDILPIILFIPILIIAGVVLYQFANIAYADTRHRMALNTASTRALDSYNNLVAAVDQQKFGNPFIDTYRTDLALTNFALANAIAIQKGPTEASPTGSLTDQDRLNIQQLLSQSIREGQISTVLNPRNPGNWEILASIYRQISGVADNALAFSLNAYGRAIQLDPLNPILRLNVGGIYYSARNYDLAIRFFSDAVNLKPDLANAYYNLSIALREKGDLAAAEQTAQQVVTLLQRDTNNPDYRLASEYLADLKARIATSSANQSQFKPTTASQSSALQQQNLPQVLDLPNQTLEATPAAAPTR